MLLSVVQAAFSSHAAKFQFTPVLLYDKQGLQRKQTIPQLWDSIY